MNTKTFRRIDELFAAALERDRDTRQTFLDEACAGDATLRQEVETMLQIAAASEEFLETPLFDVAATLLTEETQRLPSSVTTTAPIDNARFIPGQLVAGRYRIVGLLGRGGMGEVYRADDLRLSQPVALKFLAESLARDGAALARFHREVSVSRQISHRHVCRVYDIGEHAGMQFLSMEYVRGEELSSLLKRIGRLPHDKAVAVARQLCAGLAAIHDAGVLHRDLKPANIMIDEHGDVRITDFGIVALAEGVSGREAMIGTPAYMSPEQLTGGELSTRSDIYSLGLVFHEFFTGKRRDRSAKTTATTVVEVDPAIERVIARCVDPDPAKRPVSALQIAAALPGGDPLAAALAAGETPSPQMVAAAPTEGSLRPRSAALLLLAIVASLLLVTLSSRRTALHRIVPLERSPALLEETAANIARTAGYTLRGDTAWGFDTDDTYLEYVSRQVSPNWEALHRGQPAAVFFWYRQSPRPLAASLGWSVGMLDPPNDTSGMVHLQLDSTGRLTYFHGVPSATETLSKRANWAPFFAAAGLDPAAFRPARSQWRPPEHSDERMAWSGVYPARPELTLRIEAASYRGQPTYFEVVGPWRTHAWHEPPSESAPQAFGISLFGMFFGALGLAALLAWKNVRLGRGDRRGAFRLAMCTFSMRMFMWIVFAHHVPTFDEVVALIRALQSALYWGCTIGLLYLALEPFVRRRWPEWLISWSRLLAGEVRDPLVGRDLLIGGAFAGAILLGNQIDAIPQLLGGPLPTPSVSSPRLIDLGLLGARGFVALLVNQLSAALLFSFVILAVLLFFALITRNKKVAAGATWLIFVLVISLRFESPSLLSVFFSTITPTILLLVLTRYGVLALVTTVFFTHFSVFYPITTDLTAWYATSFMLELFVLAALTLYAFRTSLGGQRLIRAGLFDE